jgi:hypothetical protein
MTKIPGELLIDVWKGMSDERMCRAVHGIRAALGVFWQMPPGQVMYSASGDGIRDPSIFFDDMTGLYDSTLRCYAGLTGHGRYTDVALKAHTDESVQVALANDTIVWMHADLRMYSSMRAA